jgi:hypothetical protein
MSVDPISVVLPPPGHSRQKDFATSDWYVPLGQGRHGSNPVLDTKPGLHSAAMIRWNVYKVSTDKIADSEEY